VLYRIPVPRRRSRDPARTGAWRRARRPTSARLKRAQQHHRTCRVSVASFPAIQMCQRRTQGDRAATIEIVEGLPDLEPICELPPLAIPLADCSKATGPCVEEPLDEARTLLRNRNDSEIFGQPEEPVPASSVVNGLSTCADPVLTELVDQSQLVVAAPRPAVLVSKEGHEIEVSDVSPSAAIAELVDAAWNASATSQSHGIARVYMPFSTASVRKAAAMIQASIERRRATPSRKRKISPAQQEPALGLLRRTAVGTGNCRHRLPSSVGSGKGCEGPDAA